ncbi:hypothetical protein [Salmonella enterica]|uniref:hypothetical protein n=1 Tax=Salmonella enterica TaxID=28901 RepID=UPI0039EFD4B3
MVDLFINVNCSSEIYIYWGMQDSKDFYSALPQQWSEQHDNVHYIPVVSGDDAEWGGRKGFVTFTNKKCSARSFNAHKSIFL